MPLKKLLQSGGNMNWNLVDTRYSSVPKIFYLAGTRYEAVPDFFKIPR